MPTGKGRGAKYLRKAMYKGRKTALRKITEVELECPYCHETIPSPGGRLAWDVNEIGEQNAEKCVCPECGKALRFPKVD